MNLHLYRTAHVIVERDGEDPYVLCTMSGIQGDTASLEMEITVRDSETVKNLDIANMLRKEAERFQRSLRKEFKSV